ncbi:hypothetical protein F66182_6841 [Fusarium sp. NRRL 66182]|nr:hypothetical protein F66182_6841 [Fusarium sp. NRRL 66182]
MACQDFHCFPLLPPELRLAIWEAALRPFYERGGAIHHFYMSEYQPGFDWDVRSRRVASLDLLDYSHIPHKYRDSVSYSTSIPSSSQAIGHVPLRQEGARSVYFWDYGMWAACRESRQVIYSRFQPQKWEKIAKGLDDKSHNFYDIFSILEAAWGKIPSHQNLSNVIMPAKQGRGMPVATQPMKDLYIIHIEGWGKEPEEDEGFHVDLVFRDASFSPSSKAYPFVANIGIEYNESWLEYMQLTRPWRSSDWLAVSQVGFITALLDSCATMEISTKVWLIDRQARTCPTCKAWKWAEAPRRVFYDNEQEYVEEHMEASDLVDRGSGHYHHAWAVFYLLSLKPWDSTRQDAGFLDEDGELPAFHLSDHLGVLVPRFSKDKLTSPTTEFPSVERPLYGSHLLYPGRRFSSAVARAVAAVARSLGGPITARPLAAANTNFLIVTSLDGSLQRYHLALQLQREEVEEWERAKKGKQREGEVTDSELAIKTLCDDLKSIEASVADRALSLSIAKAVEADAQEIAALAATEKEAAQDREFAVRLSRDHLAAPEVSQEDEQPLHSGILDKLRQLYIGPIAQAYDIDGLPGAESSSWAASRRNAMPVTEQCLGCLDYFPELALTGAPCSHHYCRVCLVGLIQASFRDESLFPPRCCHQPIPIESSNLFFTPQLVGEFKAKKLEFEAKDRTYCSDPTCSTFIPSQLIETETGTCPRCSKKTCVLCKAASHTGVCPKDTASQEVLRIAQAAGWQQCKSCKRIVELEHGCNHMTCRCGAEFCYVCGTTWKTCSCPVWSEEMLYARARVLANRHNGAAQMNPAVRRAQIQAARHHLVENHECTHERWRGLNGPRECEECHDVMPVFIYECRQCSIMACRRCRYNRL